jgi:OOP family OmpA-OmpF porin
MKKQFSSIVAAGLILGATVAFGANRAEQFSISPVIGGYTFEGKQHLKTNLVYGARVGYNVSDNFGIEALYDYVNTKPKNGGNKIDMNRFGGDLLYHFMPENVFVPYLAVGLSGLNFENAGVDKKPHVAFDYGVGAKYFVTDRFALRGDVRHIIYSYSSQTLNNLEYTLGAYIPFGGEKPAAKMVAAPAPEPVPAPKAVEPTPAPVPVAAASAAPSATLTVVPASVVKGQTATLSWKSQNASDCTIKPGIGPVSSQGTKIITPAADTTFNLECSGNGGTAASTAEVTVTAPAKKLAPVVPAVTAAAERFCSKPAVINIQFDTDKSAIKPQHDAELKTVASFLKEFPAAKGEISGHTDTVGSKAYNEKLSQSRADSVKKYIVDKFGISADRITAKGYGFARPVTSNKTREGKARNRRIEANFSCE